MEIEFWKNSRGEEPVADFIDNEPVKARSLIVKKLEMLEKYGLVLIDTPLVKPLTGYKNLYEFRIKYNKIAYRIFFTIYKSVGYLLHVFKKKTMHTPLTELKIAESRRQSLVSLLK
jgi:phage-related protein